MKLEINVGVLEFHNYVEIKQINGPKKDCKASKRIISDEWKWIINI